MNAALSSDPVMWLVGLAGMMVILIGAVLVAMIVADRLGWPRVAIGIGALGALYFAGTALHTLIWCAGACEGPSGTLSYAYAQIAAPVAALYLAVVTRRRWTELRGMQNG